LAGGPRRRALETDAAVQRAKLEAWIKARREGDQLGCLDLQTETAKIGPGPVETDYVRSVFDADDGVVIVCDGLGQLGAWMVKLSQGRIKAATYQAFAATEKANAR
jgi:hypothetical protein